MLSVLIGSQLITLESGEWTRAAPDATSLGDNDDSSQTGLSQSEAQISSFAANSGYAGAHPPKVDRTERSTQQILVCLDEGAVDSDLVSDWFRRSRICVVLLNCQRAPVRQYVQICQHGI